MVGAEFHGVERFKRPRSCCDHFPAEKWFDIEVIYKAFTMFTYGISFSMRKDTGFADERVLTRFCFPYRRANTSSQKQGRSGRTGG